jgi:predicted GTPase
MIDTKEQTYDPKPKEEVKIEEEPTMDPEGGDPQPENILPMLDSPEMKTEIEKMNEALRARQENDVRIAVIGNVDSGKSTLVGCMTKCVKDDGRGSARKMVFNFSHEAANGRTSSIGQEIMGFDKDHK